MNTGDELLAHATVPALDQHHAVLAFATINELILVIVWRANAVRNEWDVDEAPFDLTLPHLDLTLLVHDECGLRDRLDLPLIEWDLLGVLVHTRLWQVELAWLTVAPDPSVRG